MPDLFADRYDIQQELGRGAFGVVFLARDTRLRGRKVALKILHPGLNADPAVVRLFHNEAGALASLEHDNIVTVYDAGVWEGRRYIAMAYVPGPSLAQIVAEQGPQPPDRVADWLAQIARALAYAHDQGMLHRDIKSANILLDEQRHRIIVTDFGLAKAVESSGGSAFSSDARALTGTAAYRAPEVAKQGHSRASDLYSLGAVAYELLAGRRPFIADDPLSVMLLHATEPVPPLPETTPPWLAELVMQMLEKDPAKRPQSAQEVVRGCEVAESRGGGSRGEASGEVERDGGVAGEADSQSGGESSGNRGKRGRGVLWAALAGVAVLALIGIFFVFGRGGQEQPTPEVIVVTASPTPQTADEKNSPPPTPTPMPPTHTPIPSTATPLSPTATATATRTPTPTPTKTSTRIPTPTPEPDAVVIPKTNMNVRAGPGTNYPIIGSAKQGQSYRVTGKNAGGDWWRIDYSGSHGWLANSLVKGQGNLFQVAVVPSPPPPTSTPTTSPSQDQGYWNDYGPFNKNDCVVVNRNYTNELIFFSHRDKVISIKPNEEVVITLDCEHLNNETMTLWVSGTEERRLLHYSWPTCHYGTYNGHVFVYYTELSAFCSGYVTIIPLVLDGDKNLILDKIYMEPFK